MNVEREIKMRAISNWLANCIGMMQEQYRRPNYNELLVKMTLVDEQIPEIKKLLIYLVNTKDQ